MEKTVDIVTRFAPSPTGFLHIGGARTALFNWLFARANDGKMRLRIEDTDRKRSTDAAVEAILGGLAWLGLEHDGEVVFQHSRLERHKEIAHQLLASGAAYKCTCTPDEIEAMREKARKTGKAPRYDGSCRHKGEQDFDAQTPYVIRFKTPESGHSAIEDQVQGQIKIANDQLDDLILLRSNGTPTYMLSVVVDDYDMAVTHIIRGDDHASNAIRQSLIYRAMGWQLPVFAHIPLIHGADGAKLSKRHGALGIEAYRAMGYLPAALRNYLVRLGWSHGDDEIISTEQMIEWFGLEAIGRAPARFDFARLKNLNGIYLRAMDDDELLDILLDTLPYLERGPELEKRLNDTLKERLLRAIPGLKARAKTLNDMVAAAEFIFAQRPIVIEEKAAKALGDEGRAVLAALLPQLENISEWSLAEIEKTIREHAAAKDIKFGKIAQPLRSALTGTPVSPGIFDVLYALGQEESIARIEDQTSV